MRMSLLIKRWDLFGNTNQWTGKHEKTFIGAFMVFLLLALTGFLIFDAVDYMDLYKNYEVVYESRAKDQSYKTEDLNEKIFAIR